MIERKKSMIKNYICEPIMTKKTVFIEIFSHVPYTLKDDKIKSLSSHVHIDLLIIQYRNIFFTFLSFTK